MGNDKKRFFFGNLGKNKRENIKNYLLVLWKSLMHFLYLFETHLP